ncbi:hypothetical protein, partial [Pseudomonas aeruginosa]|uniref:hypothetical protein n=1 Tax=Pseudomonas aeruginosa TaxID=287 RepID=UPI002739380A
RLCLAAEPQAGGREVSAAKAARKTLAYDFFRFLYSPQLDNVPTLDGRTPSEIGLKNQNG